jgi:hypothetical protein
LFRSEVFFSDYTRVRIFIKTYEKANPRQILYEAEKVTDIDVTDLKAATDRIRTKESYIAEIEQLKQEIEQTNLEITVDTNDDDTLNNEARKS